jgi:ADP-ribose pyrophosphatase YjhB (NUDIX family)
MTAIKECDHKSVGMIVWKEGKMLLIERKKPPFGMAPPAGHLDEDGDDFEKAAIRELEEEVGLKAERKDLRLLIEGRAENPCRRPGGTWHYWKIFEVKVEGEIQASPNEVKKFNWYNKEDLLLFAKRTEKYRSGVISQQEWEQSPGLEPVCYDWFKKLKIIG